MDGWLHEPHAPVRMRHIALRRAVVVQVLQLECDLDAKRRDAARSPLPPVKQDPSAAELLPEIVRLWYELNIPMLGRSQFLLAHEGKPSFFYQAELAHLKELQQCAPVRVHLAPANTQHFQDRWSKHVWFSEQLPISLQSTSASTRLMRCPGHPCLTGLCTKEVRPVELSGACKPRTKAALTTDRCRFTTAVHAGI